MRAGGETLLGRFTFLPRKNGRDGALHRPAPAKQRRNELKRANATQCSFRPLVRGRGHRSAMSLPDKSRSNMRSHRTEWMAPGLATTLIALLVMWQVRRPAASLPPSPIASGSPAVASGASERQSHELLPPSEPVVAAVDQPGLSLEARQALVMARFWDWEEEDRAELRPQRMQELEALLAGTNMFAIVQALPPNLMDYAFALPALHQRMMADPKAAADWMNSHTNISEAHIFTLVHDWGQKDREELREYLAGLPEGEWKQKAMAAASGETLSSDPVEAIVWAEQMSPGERQTGLLGMATLDWAKRDPDTAAQWVGRVNDPALREQLVGSLAVGYADTDPAQAAECALQSLRPGDVLDRSVAEIAWTWAMREPTAAIGWVAQFPEGPARQMALGHVMGIWGNRDRAAALVWIENLPRSSLQTEAAADLLATLPAAESSAP
jgi:hypothetical protein